MAFEDFWFAKDKGELSTAVFDTVRSIDQEQQGIREDWLRYSSFYRGVDVSGFGPAEWNMVSADRVNLSDSQGWNVVRAVCDTLLAKITLEKPSVDFYTSNGPEVLQRTSRWLEQYALGALEFTHSWDQLEMSLKHAIIYGNGQTKVWASESRPQVRAIHPSRITIDDLAALDSPPRSMFHTEYMSRQRLLELFPKSKGIIMQANPLPVGSQGQTAFRELIEVKEAWRLRSSGDKGRHVIVMEGGGHGVLIDDAYDKDSFPFAFQRFNDPEQGWHGMGLVEQIEGCQSEINRTLEKISGSLEHIANAFIFKHSSSQILDADILTNEWYKVIDGTTPPVVNTPPAVHPQVLQYLELQWTRAFELSGISQLSATSSNPALPRLDSADSLRMFQDIQTERFSKIVAQRDGSLETIVMKLIAAGKELRGKWKVRGVNRDFMKMIDWDDINLDEEQFSLKVSTISSLPRHPAGRRAEVQTMMKAGIVDLREARRLLEMPDLEKSNRYANASSEDLEATFEHFLDKGEFIPPLIYQDLKLGIKMGTSYLLRHKMEGAPEERIGLIARWLQEASELMTPTPDQPTLAPAPDPLESLPANPAAAQQLSQAAATLPV